MHAVNPIERVHTGGCSSPSTFMLFHKSPRFAPLPLVLLVRAPPHAQHELFAGARYHRWDHVSCSLLSPHTLPIFAAAAPDTVQPGAGLFGGRDGGACAGRDAVSAVSAAVGGRGGGRLSRAVPVHARGAGTVPQRERERGGRGDDAEQQRERQRGRRGDRPAPGRRQGRRADERGLGVIRATMHSLTWLEDSIPFDFIPFSLYSVCTAHVGLRMAGVAMYNNNK
ncbi:hypothetical protein C8R44DRAFT_921547 [Mycena epipterygia]|nr:hypothetical protein C8R44DRAFT_921547 [Mycena epipterygia]